MKLKKGWDVAGGILCLLCFLFMVQGMLFVGKDSLQVSTNMQKQNQKEQIVKEKVAYLTFDDGPSVLTKDYLKVLEEEDVKATFFLIGQQVEGEMVDVVKQTVQQGHEIGLHTYCHKAEEIYVSKDSYCEDLEKTKLCLEKKINIEPKIFRFPWGSSNSYIRDYKDEVIQEMKEEGLEYADWNVSGEDAVGYPSAYSIITNIQKDYLKYNEPVLLLHDAASCRATLEALPSIIKELKEQGYSFKTLSQRQEPCHF